jgi:hypothetical protein
MTVTVALYHEEMAFGGPEEGGWWYDEGFFIRRLKRFRGPHARVRALKFADRVNRQNRARDKRLRRPSYSSVVSTGREVALIFSGKPDSFYPYYKPHYE